MNSWRANLAKEVRHAIARAEDDKNVVGIIITGNGKGFCAGADMTELQKATEAGELATGDAREVDLSAEPGTLELPEGFAKGAFSYLATVGQCLPQ